MELKECQFSWFVIKLLFQENVTLAISYNDSIFCTLQMFYRLHVSILKLLLKGDHSEEFHDYAEYIEQAANSPFAKGCEKKDEESGKLV